MKNHFNTKLRHLVQTLSSIKFLTGVIMPNLFNIHTLSVGRRLALLIASGILGLIGLSAWFLISERTLILEERQTNVRQVVESAYGILSHY